MLDLWAVPAAGRGKTFVDFQNDVTVDDVALAHREGYRSVEHLKRYTTLGMGTDQGKTGNLAGLALMAGPVASSRSTRSARRPSGRPTCRSTLGALAGREVGAHFRPLRLTPMHDWHVAAGAEFVDAGLWRRPRYYPRAGEDLLAATLREARTVREAVGLVDVSPLGKIDVQGPDAAPVPRPALLQPGAAAAGRQGALRADAARGRHGVRRRHRLAPRRDARSTSRPPPPTPRTVMAHMEFHRQAVWPELAVEVTSITDQWAGMALAGPRSRAVLARAVAGADGRRRARCRSWACWRATIAGCPVLLLRISFSGELAYEIHTPADYGTAVWQALLAAGAADGIVPYGTEAMGTLRIEKGHVAGAELDGRTTPADLGLGRMASRTKDYVGRAALERPALADPTRPRLVGLVAKDGRSPIRSGAQIVADPGRAAAGADARPRHLGRLQPDARAADRARPGRRRSRAQGRDALRRLSACAARRTEVVVTDPVFVDPEGRRLHG